MQVEELLATNSNSGPIDFETLKAVQIEIIKTIKGNVEARLDVNNWQWNSMDSRLLDWCVDFLEAESWPGN